ncbi:ArsR family transcriptional regulator [Tateyamaria omphalii]|uniref:ArsR/SmtB family transcription factor n=1 Tax=Tateyamaria omphalii TaxID=299262 RepID=UPI001C99FB32|nr:helix-turn-helix transcriptional regulator [Tateyamaria omphalii]MBY5931976.1 ArsR family transcriptional regulator [Tateyamaria omphalii]
MVSEDAAALFRVLSNSDRLDVIRALVEAGPDGMSAGDIGRKIGASPSRTSFHLNALSETGFLQKERQSRNLNYRINFKTIGALITFLMEDCCKGSSELRNCCTMR